MGRAAHTGHVQTLSRGLAILEALYTHQDGQTLHELSQRLKCPKPSLLRLLDTLLTRGYLRLDRSTGRYALDALQMLRASNLYRPAEGRSAAIHQLLEELARRTGETAVLAVIDPRSGMAASVDHVEVPRVVRAVPPMFQPLPGLCMSLGRVYLAQLSDAEAEEVAARWALTSGGDADDVERILTDLDSVRMTGYGLMADGIEEGLAAASAGVTDAEGRTFGGVAVLAPAYRVTHGRLEEMGRAAREAAEMLSNLFARDLVAVDAPQQRQMVGAGCED